MRKNSFTIVILSIFIIMLFLCSGCVENRVKGAVEKPVIAVTIVPQKTFVEAVCGELFEVIVMVPPGYSPESYEPTPREVERFHDAAIYFSIGVPSEEFGILPNVDPDTLVYPLHEKVAEVLPDRVFDSGERDAHIWLSPRRVKLMTEQIRRVLTEFDETNAETFNTNAESYMKKLDELDVYATSLFRGAQGKGFIVYHPAFGYIAEDYGLDMYALEEEGKETTISHLSEMITLAKDKYMDTVFYQQEADGRQAEEFAQEIGGKAISLTPLAAEYIESTKAMFEAISEALR